MASLMGGKAGETPAFPPGQFYCLLDDLPWHLIPAHERLALRSISDRGPRYRINPQARFLQNDELPLEWEGLREIFEAFALQGTVAWVRDSKSNCGLPFWIGPRSKAVMDCIAQSGELPSQVSGKDLKALLAAKLLLGAEESRLIDESVASKQKEFQALSYAPVHGLIHSFHVAALRRYYRQRIRSGKLKFGDGQVARRYVAHNDGVLRLFHHQLAESVSMIAGEPVKPSYCYLAAYTEGSELKRHTDRAQCEFSVTLCLDYSPDPQRETPWPLKLELPDREVAVYQAIGDALMYRGTRIPHSRRMLPPGHSSTSVFFHYVAMDFAGPLD